MLNFGNLISSKKTGVLPGYSSSNFWRRHKLAWFFLLILFSFFYGLIFGVFGTFFLLQLLVPLVVLAVFVIWLLPDTGQAPTKLLEWLLFAFLAALLFWPDYLALALPGLPWITAIRIIGVPMAFTFLLCLSLSSEFRHRLKEVLGATPMVWKLMIGFVAISLVSIGLSSEPFFSVNKFIVAQIYWTMIFFASVYVFSKPQRMTFFGYLIFGFALYVSAIGLWEWYLHKLPWAGHIPNFLKIDDEAVSRILSAKSRAATGIYRVQSKFTTPLGLAEFLALATPFILHFAMSARLNSVKVAGFLSLPLIFYVILLSDSRLGVIGFLLSFVFYLLAWGVLRWKHREGSLYGPAMTLAYPIIFIAFVASTFFVGRLRNIVWGTKAQSFSNQARADQVADGIPMILSKPWGHGIGRGADELGYTNLGGVLTIDSYFLVTALEFGIIGFIIYYGIFVAQLVYSGLSLLKTETGEIAFLVPLTISLINFLVIKSVFAQQDNHPLVFAMLGAMTALVYRVNQTNGDPPTPPQPSPA